ncbi:MAG: helix-turn-helix transcriptional regulator [Psychrobacillus sp.]
MPVNYDPIATGKVIRQLRKEKNITLQMLSEGICSIGKMSNIEHGQTILDERELNLIAEKLNTTFENLIKPTIQEEEEKSFSKKTQEIEVLISLGYYQDAEEQLQEIRNRFSSYLLNRPSSNIPLLYLEGVIKRKLQEFSRALSKFYNILEYPPQNKVQVELRSKAFIQLGEFELEQNNFSLAAIEKYKQALFELISNKQEVSWKLYYNLSVLYLHQRDYSTSKHFFQNIQHSSNSRLYLDGLITAFSHDYTNGLDKIDKARLTFARTNNHKDVIKSIFASIYFNHYSPGKTTEECMNQISDYIKRIDLISKKPTYIQLKLTMTLLQFLGLYYIERNEQLSIEYLNWINEIEDKYDFLDLHHLTLTLKAMFLKKFEPNEIDKRKELLHSALKICRESKFESSYIQKYILKELAELYDEKDSFSYQALLIFNYSIPFEHLDLVLFDMFMPEIIKLG